MRFEFVARRLVYALVAITGAATAATSEAQVIVGRGGSVSVYVPGVGGVRLGAPRLYGRPYGVARGVIVDPLNAGRLTGPPLSRFDAVPESGGGRSVALPTPDELHAMSDSQLLNATIALTAQLDADLLRFDTGDTWQRYLRLPASALQAPSGERVAVDRDSLREYLKRFERTGANPRYVQIASVPSFQATHAALAELVARISRGAPGPPDEVPTATRRTPPPVPSPPPPVVPAPPQRRGIVNRNAHAAPRRIASPAARSVPAAVDPARSAEVLPAPRPSTASSPSSATSGEHSILAK